MSRQFASDYRPNPVLRQALAESGHEDWAQSLQRCGTAVREVVCEACGYQHTVAVKCHLKACPNCLRLRAFRIQKKYLRAANRLREPKFWTLTLRSTKQLAHGVKDIRRSFEKFRRRASMRRCLDGGLYAIEANPQPDGYWNVHLHVLCQARFRPQEFLSRVWEEVTGGSYIVHVNAVRSPQRAMKYVLEYCSKGPANQEEPWPVERVIQYLETLQDVRMIQAFGIMLGAGEHGARFVCPKCGECLWRIVLITTGEVQFSEVERLRALAMKLGP